MTCYYYFFKTAQLRLHSICLMTNRLVRNAQLFASSLFLLLPNKNSTFSIENTPLFQLICSFPLIFTSFCVIISTFLTVSVSTTDEYMISDSSDNIIAYRIVHMPDDAKEQVYQSASTSILPAVSQNVQYIVIDSSNGMVQTVPTPQVTSSSQITSTAAATTATKVDAATSKLPRSRASIAIAPKATAIKANVRQTLHTILAQNNSPNHNSFFLHTLGQWILKLPSKTR